MSSSNKGELIVPVAQSNLPDQLRGIRSLSDLFNLQAAYRVPASTSPELQADEYVSVMDYDPVDDGWPELDDIDNPEIKELVESYIDQVDINDPSSINNFAENILKEISILYRRLSQNDLVKSQIKNITQKEPEATFSMQDLEQRIAPLLKTQEDREPSWWNKLWGEKPQEQLTSREIKQSLVKIEADLNAQTTRFLEITTKSERLFKNIQRQHDHVASASQDLQIAESHLFAAYIAGRQILKEWYSENVMTAYFGLTQFDKISAHDVEYTEFVVPETARKWADLTFALDRRLTQCRNTYLENAEITGDIPTEAKTINDFLEQYKIDQEESNAKWREAAQKVRQEIGFIRVEQDIEELHERAKILARTIVNNEKFTANLEKTFGKSQQTDVYKTAQVENEKTKEELEQKGINIDAEYKRLSTISDQYHAHFGLTKQTRPDSLVTILIDIEKDAHKKKPRGMLSRFGL